MELIDKNALVAEIEKLKQEIESQDYAACAESYIIGVKHTLETISDILDALKAKEVDLEKEIKRFTMSKELYEADSVIKAVAEHFFELGLKAQKGE